MFNCQIFNVLSVVFLSLLPFLALFSYLASKNNFLGKGKVYAAFGIFICFSLLLIGAILEGLMNNLNGC